MKLKLGKPKPKAERRLTSENPDKLEALAAAAEAYKRRGVSGLKKLLAARKPDSSGELTSKK